MNRHQDTPGVIAPPPLIFLGFLFAGWGLGHLVAEASLGLPDLLRRSLALLGLGAGLGVEGWAAGMFRRANTAVQPWKPSTALVTTGIYRFTRNPIYLGFAVTYLGLAVGLDSPVALVGILPCLFIMDRFVIAREETYLEARFGPVYLDYKKVVRRWL